MIWSKTIYLEVEADDADTADDVVCSIVDGVHDARALNWDLAGPIEETNL